jgi:DNA-binding transcriptional LysR family regulator
LQVFDRLKAFVMIVQEGSLSSASKKLHITQPALSARLKLLEDDLSCQLLERTGRGTKTTTIGKLVYAVALDIIQRMDDLKLLVKNNQELKEGWIHLGGDSTAISGILPDAISSYKNKFKEIRFTLREEKVSNTIQSLVDGTIHLGVFPYLASYQEDERFKSLTIHFEIPDKFQLIVPQNHVLVSVAEVLKAKKQKLLPIHIHNQPIILYEDESFTAHELELDFKRLGIKPQVAMFLRSNQSVTEMVRKGIGISLMSEYLIHEEHGIRRLEIEGISISRKLVVCTNPHMDMPLAVHEFLEVLLSLYGKNKG